MITEIPTDRDAFEAALDADPDDWSLRLVYADWLDENGDADLARCQRWMAANRKRPVCRPPAFLHVADGWDWSLGNESLMYGIPRHLGKWMPWPGPSESSYREYPTRRAAERALATALSKQDDSTDALKAAGEAA
jgi:uncharacterized protein (TIGR02996 family)